MPTALENCALKWLGLSYPTCAAMRVTGSSVVMSSVCASPMRRRRTY